MRHYVDGYILLVPKKTLRAYKRMAAEGGRLWTKYGALDYKECLIDDEAPRGVVRTFRKMTGAKPSETIVFSFITYRSKKQRDAIQAKVMTYYDQKYAGKQRIPMPFALDRMTFAGFQSFVDVGAER